jgi:hypothetical protein
MKVLIKLQESDIDNILDLNAKILLTIYYNYFDKLKLFSMASLNRAKHIYLLAVYCGNFEIMEYLENYGFDIDIKENKDVEKI